MDNWRLSAIRDNPCEPDDDRCDEDDGGQEEQLRKVRASLNDRDGMEADFDWERAERQQWAALACLICWHPP